MTDATTLRTGSLRIRARCACGSGIDVTSNPPGHAEGIHEQWKFVHTGDGHRMLRPGESMWLVRAPDPARLAAPPRHRRRLRDAPGSRRTEVPAMTDHGRPDDALSRVQGALASGNRTRREDVKSLATEVERSRLLLDKDLTYRDLEAHIRDGKFDLHMVSNPEEDTSTSAALRFVAALWLHILLGEDNVEPPNYRSCEFSITPADTFETWRMFAEVVKPGGRSSHELRIALEAEVASLREQVQAGSSTDG